MCGFGGIISWKKKITINHLSKVASQVAFRGPDNTGIKIYDCRFRKQDTEGEVGLFFNRLAIIDLDKRSNQPFENERYVLVFNGEIYNYKEIRKDLLHRKISFITSSDTEVLFNALIEYGSAAIGKLNGMFAFAFIDKIERRILLARDRAGIKPLNFLLNVSGFAFASETDSIIRLFGEKPPVSTEAVNSYLSLQYIPTPLTVWEKVYKLPPGCYIEAQIDELQNRQELNPATYWNAYEQINRKQTGIHNLEQLLCDSLKSQLQSDVPLGLFLSSGIDSSLLAALINKHFSKENQFDYFTVAFDNNSGHQADEYKDAQKFLEGFENKNFNHHVLHANPALIQDELTSMYSYLDEPFGDYAVMLNYVISQKAKEHVTVVLSGDGSDELFWGYPRYNDWTKQQKSFLRQLGFMGSFLKVLPQSSFTSKWQRRFSADPVESYLSLVSSNYYFTGTSLLNYPYWWSQNINDLKFRKDLPSLIDFKTYLSDCMFYKVDRSSMGASLEVRVPFVDNHVIDFALQMEAGEKSTSRHSTKSPLKDLLGELAPHYQFNLPKRGFSLPLKNWIDKEWKDLVFSDNVKSQLKTFGLSDGYTFHLKNHYNQGKDQSIEIWRLLNLALWLETKNRSL